MKPTLKLLVKFVVGVAVLIGATGVGLLILTSADIEKLQDVDQLIDRSAVPLLFFRLTMYGIGIRYLPIWRRIVPEQRRESRLLIAAVCVIYEIVVVQRIFF